jgi:hypothetical protein
MLCRACSIQVLHAIVDRSSAAGTRPFRVMSLVGCRQILVVRRCSQETRLRPREERQGHVRSTTVAAFDAIVNALLAPFTRSGERWPPVDDTDRLARCRGGGLPTKRPSEDRQRAVTAFIVPALLSNGVELTGLIDRIAARVDEAICCQSPALLTRSRSELVSALVAGDDAITHVSVKLSNIAVVGATSLVEWETSGRFTRPAFLDDDLMIEPTGQLITTSGVMVLTFAGDRVGDIRCYYDAVDLDDQLLERHTGLSLRG